MDKLVVQYFNATQIKDFKKLIVSLVQIVKLMVGKSYKHSFSTIVATTVVTVTD